MAARHRIGGRQLGRNSGQRRALYRNLLVSLVTHERIRTTEAKAKEIQPMIEKLITIGRTDTPHNRNNALSILANETAVQRLFEEVGPRFVTRPGGYTRIFKINMRPGDGAVVCQIEMVE
jgi:large subunit ribosomal protein L17